MSAASAGLVCRAMVEADLAAVLAVEQAVCPFPWTAGNFRDSLAAGHGAWVLEEGGAVVGYALTMQAVDECSLLTIGVAAARQGSGLGAALLRHVCAEARARGARRLFLEVRASNVGARGFYAHAGFAEIGRRRGYYPAHDGREDAIAMAMDL